MGLLPHRQVQRLVRCDLFSTGLELRLSGQEETAARGLAEQCWTQLAEQQGVLTAGRGQLVWAQATLVEGL